MEKPKQQVKKEVETVIKGFIISFVDEYCELNAINRTKEACHLYVKLKVDKAKQAFINVLSIDYDEKIVQSFKTIESNWLVCIETLNDFELFLNEINKKI
nr:hypothetical protein [uncultured Flavobacterium sp.]